MGELIGFLLIGLLAGWIATKLMKGRLRGARSFRLVGNLIVGCLGALLGRFLFSLAGLKVGDGLPGSLLAAVLGAVALLFLLSRANPFRSLGR